MGPSIILDKSAYQCLSKEDTFELSTYFHVVVPPVLILEILADLKKPGIDPAQAQDAVRKLARKIQPVDGIVNLHYRGLCISDLLGGNLAMDRRPVVGGARRVRAADGSIGAFIDVQPENEALIRWSCGMFGEAEELLADQWRAAWRAVDLPTLQRQLRRKIDRAVRPTLPLVRKVVDEVLKMPTAQLLVMEALIEDIQTIPEVRQWTLGRWRQAGDPLLSDFARYAHHCARVSLIFHQALAHRLIGTRSTNRIDMEYLYYTPFAYIFCSGDKLHIKLAQEILGADQSFVHRDELRNALREVANARRKAREPGHGRPAEIQPGEDSLIRKLWKKHWGKWPDKPPGTRQPLSKEKEVEAMKKVKPFMDAIKSVKPKPRPRWPCP